MRDIYQSRERVFLQTFLEISKRVFNWSQMHGIFM